MRFKLGFLEEALKEWEKLDHGIREQFKAKLNERLDNPRVPASKLAGHPDRYKIKLRSAGYRMVYEDSHPCWRYIHIVNKLLPFAHQFLAAPKIAF